MSRRKQLNPKPLKHDKTDNDDEGGDVTRDESADPAQMLETLAEGENLPRGVFKFQHVESKGIAVCCVNDLPSSCTFGPYRGSVVAAEETQAVKLAFGDETVWFKVGPESGRWLTRLRMTTTHEQANAQLTLHGSDAISLETYRSIAANEEVVSVAVRDQKEPRSAGVAILNENESSEETSEVKIDEAKDAQMLQPTARSSTPPATLYPLIYDCPHCGVRFSNPSTLQAHLKFYCSKKPAENRAAAEAPSEKSQATSTTSTDLPYCKTEPPTSPTAVASTSPTATKTQTETYCRECNIQFSSMTTFKAHKEFYCEIRRRSKPRNEAVAKDESAAEETAGVKGVAAANMAWLEHVRQFGADMAATPRVLLNGYLPHPFAALPFGISPILMQPYLPVPAVSAAAVVPATETRVESTSNKEQEEATSSSVEKAEVEIKVEAAADQPLDLTVKKSSPGSTLEKKVHVPQLSPHSPPAVTNPPKAAETPVLYSPEMKPNILSPVKSPVAGELQLKFSKCPDCNVVFYQEENFRVHRAHYCVATRRLHSNAATTAEILNPKASTVTSQPVVPPFVPGRPLLPDEIRHMEESQLACIPCRIRFTSKENLQLHQQYYCRLRASSSEVGATLIEPYYCLPCNIRFSNLDTLNAHQQYYCPTRPDASASGIQSETTPNASPTKTARNQQPGFPAALEASVKPTAPAEAAKCPRCDELVKDDDLLEHLKQHSPVKSYRCSLCGYRGNTVRGMRMHGKMHTDAGEHFNDTNICEQEIINTSPVISPRRPRLSSASENETELLIRQKNTPYKKRKSRHHSYEAAAATESASSIRRHAPHNCIVCNATFSDTTRLRSHMREHQDAEKSFQCRSCDFQASNKSFLVRHVKMVHEAPAQYRPISAEQCEETPVDEEANGETNLTVSTKIIDTRKCFNLNPMLTEHATEIKI